MIYLASQSARRKEILTKLGIPMKVIASSYKESDIPGITPGLLTMCHALGKVRMAKVPKAAWWVMGCDTIVYCQNQILGKPKNRPEARKMLSMLSGTNHAVYSGLVLWDRNADKFLKGFEKTDVFIKDLGEEEIEEYLDVISPYDKAGSYAIQTGPQIVTDIRGSYTNVVGLPVELMIRLVKQVA